LKAIRTNADVEAIEAERVLGLFASGFELRRTH
jgi:hypothetical protein